MTFRTLARRAWQVRPTLLETALFAVLPAAIHFLFGLPLLYGLAAAALLLIAVTVAIAALELQAEALAAEADEPPEGEPT